MQTDLPARPDLPFSTEFTDPPAPKKRSKWTIVGSIVGGLIVLGAIQGIVESSDQGSTTIPSPIVGPAEESNIEDAQASAAPLLMQVSDELDQITMTSSVSNDVVHLNNAADFLDQAAAYFLGVDEFTYDHFSSAADHIRTSTVAYGSGDYTTAETEMSAAQADIQAVQTTVA